MYIFREQEYRRTIEELKNEIDRISQKPLQEQKKQTEDQQHLIGIKVQLNKNDPNAPLDEEDVEQDRGKIPVFYSESIKLDQLPPEKFVTDTLNEMDQMHKGIQGLQGVTQNILQRDKQQLWKQLDEELEKYRSQLQFENEKKKESETDFVEAEKELNEHLETMTNMA